MLHPRRYREAGTQRLRVDDAARYLHRRRLAVKREHRLITDVLHRRQESRPSGVAGRIRK